MYNIYVYVYFTNDIDYIHVVQRCNPEDFHQQQRQPAQDAAPLRSESQKTMLSLSTRALTHTHAHTRTHAQVPFGEDVWRSSRAPSESGARINVDEQDEG